MSATLPNRIQPCLLDRLTDKHPSQSKEIEGATLMSLEEYRSSVARDLRWLFSTGAPPEVQPKSGHSPPADYYLNPAGYARALESAPAEVRSQWTDLRRFPRVAHSVIAYGLRQVVCRQGAWEERFKSELLRVLLAFEPRIVPETISVSALPEQQYLHVTIAGRLLAFPTNKDFELRARIDRESGEIHMN